VNSYPDVLLHVDGQWRPGRAGETLPVHDPASGDVIGRVAVAELEDLDAALAAAARGFELWRRVPAVERAKTVHGQR
jgi:succinate-semialdehyde dehydrogenase / glutarate-semialdehyde dehydrogenase